MDCNDYYGVCIFASVTGRLLLKRMHKTSHPSVEMQKTIFITFADTQTRIHCVCVIIVHVIVLFICGIYNAPFRDGIAYMACVWYHALKYTLPPISLIQSQSYCVHTYCFRICFVYHSCNSYTTTGTRDAFIWYFVVFSCICHLNCHESHHVRFTQEPQQNIDLNICFW